MKRIEIFEWTYYIARNKQQKTKTKHFDTDFNIQMCENAQRRTRIIQNSHKMFIWEEREREKRKAKRSLKVASRENFITKGYNTECAYTLIFRVFCVWLNWRTKNKTRQLVYVISFLLSLSSSSQVHFIGKLWTISSEATQFRLLYYIMLDWKERNQIYRERNRPRLWSRTQPAKEMLGPNTEEKRKSNKVRQEEEEKKLNDKTSKKISR